MELGMIELGRMGANMAERLMRAGHRVIASKLIGFDSDRLIDKPQFRRVWWSCIRFWRRALECDRSNWRICTDSGEKLRALCSL